MTDKTKADDSKARVVPAHVPPELVADFDIYGLAVGDDPQAALAKLLDGPPVFYMPRSMRNPDGFGSWVFTRAADIRSIVQDTEHFSNLGIAAFDRMVGDGETWATLPAESDPPKHTAYRALLNPLFSPMRIKAHELAMRTHTVGLIEQIAPKGQCDMVLLARKLPAGIFSVLLGLSVEETLRVIDFVKMCLHSGYDVEKMRAGARGILAIEAELIERRRNQPGDDLISIALAAKVDGQPLTEGEIKGMFFFFLFAGLDTIAGATSFMFRYLARHPDSRRELAADAAKIPDAIEESLRRHGQITTNRFVKTDVELHGVRLKKGDNVLCPLVLANLDPASLEIPPEAEVRANAEAGPAIAPEPEAQPESAPELAPEPRRRARRWRRDQR